MVWPTLRSRTAKEQNRTEWRTDNIQARRLSTLIDMMLHLTTAETLTQTDVHYTNGAQCWAQTAENMSWQDQAHATAWVLDIYTDGHIIPSPWDTCNEMWSHLHTGRVNITYDHTTAPQTTWNGQITRQNYSSLCDNRFLSAECIPPHA